MTSYRIDWLTFTVNGATYPMQDDYRGWSNAAAWVGTHVLKSLVEFHEVKKPAAFYEASVRDERTGATFDFNSDDRQGSRVVLPGAFWGVWADCSFDILKTILEWEDVKVTRLDLAVDYQDTAPTTTHYRDWAERDTKGKPRQVSIIQSDSGSTFKIGSRRSAFMTRIYDKGLQTKGDPLHRRIELEIKRHEADHYARLIVDDPLVGVYLMRKQLGQFPGKPWDVLTDLLEGREMVVNRPVRPPADAIAWYRDQVAPALQKLALRDPETAAEAIQLLIAASVPRLWEG